MVFAPLDGAIKHGETVFEYPGSPARLPADAFRATGTTTAATSVFSLVCSSNQGFANDKSDLAIAGVATRSFSRAASTSTRRRTRTTARIQGAAWLGEDPAARWASGSSCGIGSQILGNGVYRRS